MLKKIRHEIVHCLLEKYRQNTPQVLPIEQALHEKKLQQIYFDHFAIIDLPSTHSGIHVLEELFSILGFHTRGKDYLKDKQNDFLWLAEADADFQIANHVLPQVVVADFRLQEMPHAIQAIIEKYASHAQPLQLDQLAELANAAEHGDASAASLLQHSVLNYLQGRDWELPSVHEFEQVQQFNELLAWVLIFGRQPNHFTLSIHLLNDFKNLAAFQNFIETTTGLKLNRQGGWIKGSKRVGIEQGSTLGVRQRIRLKDGIVELPTGFVEFVWRFPLQPIQPHYWKDFYNGFIPQNADHVIESLYKQP